MKTKIIFALALCAGLSADAATTLRIKGTKVLESRNKGGSQNLGFAKTATAQKEYFYRFDVQSVSPQSSGALKFEWAVMYEDWEGRMRVGTHGTCETNVGMTRATSIETETIELNERNWQGAHGRSGKVEDKIAGYGLRVWDKNGNLIAEEYEPSSLKKDFDWKKVAEQPNEEALRALKGLLGGGRDDDRRGPPPVRRRD